MNLKEFLIITKAEKNKWTMRCFHKDLKRDIHFYYGKIERKKDTRKYHKFLTDQNRLVGEELLHCNIAKSGLSTVWLDDLMKEWKEIHTQFIQIFSQTTKFRDLLFLITGASSKLHISDSEMLIMLFVFYYLK